MNVIREQLSKPVVLGIVAFVVGMLFGWLAIGWGIWPVTYSGAYPRDLIYAEKVDYLRLAIESYGYNRDPLAAQAKFDYLEDDNQKALNEIASNPGTLDPQLVLQFSAIVSSEPLQLPPVTGETPPQEEAPKKTNLITSVLLPLLCVIVLVVAAVLIYLFVLRGRGFTRTGAKTPAMEANEAKRQVAYTDYAAQGAEAPVVQFLASYKLGDDLFDDSFSIDSASGEFLGECGVGISETIGVGEPKKVTAFEVWLFDKNDIQTVTKVVMSAYAFYDEALRQRLEAKGEPVLAEVGAETVLETNTLQLVARVAQMSYGNGAGPDESFFDQFMLELSIWQK